MHANDLCWPLFSLRACCFGALNHILAVRCGLLDAASGCVFSDFYSVQWGMSVFLDFFNASRYCTRAPPPLSRTNAQDVHSIKLRKTNTNYSQFVTVSIPHSSHLQASILLLLLVSVWFSLVSNFMFVMLFLHVLCIPTYSIKLQNRAVISNSK